MNFIDKALEKAKILKKDVQPEVSRGTEPLSARVPLAGSVDLREREVLPQEISYTVTRTVAVDQEVMRRNRLITGGGEVEAAVAEGYKLLRTHILQSTNAEGKNTLMITGPQRGEGKTLTAINLAISIAQEVNQTVLLVDADLRSPSVHKYFGIRSGKGLVDHLTAGVPVSEMLINPQGVPKLLILPGGRPTVQAPELINSPLMKDLVQELKHYYHNRYVLFDLPPLLTYTDALAFAPLMDGIILVVEAGKTPREDIVRCQEMLKNFNFLGFVLNKLELSPGGYDYYPQEGNTSSKWKFKFPMFK